MNPKVRKAVVLFVVSVSTCGLIWMFGLGSSQSLAKKWRESPFANVGEWRKTASDQNERLESMKLDIEATQQERKERIENFCAQTPRKDKPDNRMIVLDKYHIAQCLTAKVGTKTWKQIYLYLQGKIKSPNMPNVSIKPKFFKDTMWKWFKKQTEQDQKKTLKNYRKIAFVREPFERLLSAYKDKFLHKQISSAKKNDYFGSVYAKRIKQYAAKRKPTAHAQSPDDEVTFPEFIAYIVRPGYMKDRHWYSYEKACDFCNVPFDFIGHYETLEQDATYFLKTAGFNDRVHFPPVTKSRTGDELLKYYSQISQEQILKLGKIYNADFLMHGYAFPGPLQSLMVNSSRTVRERILKGLARSLWRVSE